MSASRADDSMFSAPTAPLGDDEKARGAVEGAPRFFRFVDTIARSVTSSRA